jgi:hypothetical protein
VGDQSQHGCRENPSRRRRSANAIRNHRGHQHACRPQAAARLARRAQPRRVESSRRSIVCLHTGLRNRLGHELAEHHRLLPRFVAFLDDAGLETVTVAAALGWVTAPDVDPSSTVGSHRMTIARGFARHMAGLDPRTEIPPFGLVGSRRHRHEPYIFSPDDIDALVTGAQRLRTRFGIVKLFTLFGGCEDWLLWRLR